MVDYNEIKGQLRQKQGELAGQRVHMDKRMLRTGIQSLPQRKHIGRFNRQLREQSRRYGEQISDIDAFLLAQEEQDSMISSMSMEKETPIFQPIPIPTITIFNNPKLNQLRNRFRKGGKWF